MAMEVKSLIPFCSIACSSMDITAAVRYKGLNIELFEIIKLKSILIICLLTKVIIKESRIEGRIRAKDVITMG